MSAHKIRLDAAQVVGGKDVASRTITSPVAADLGASCLMLYTPGAEETDPGTAVDVSDAAPLPTKIIGTPAVTVAGVATDAKLDALIVLLEALLPTALVGGRFSVDVGATAAPATLPLPALASTAAKQDAGNTSLASLVTGLSSLATAAAQTTAQTSLGSMVTHLGNVASDTLAMVISLASLDAKATSSPATSTLQGTGNTSLASILAALAAGIKILDALGNASGLTSGWLSSGAQSIPAAGYVVKASPGNFGQAVGLNGTGGSAFLQVHNAASTAALSTSTIKNVTAASVGNAAAGSLAAPTGGTECSVGIVLAWSSTQFTYTAVGANTGGGIGYYR